MSLDIKVPPVGESITEVTLTRWLKKDGDSVAMDEVIAELESDKATFELTAEKAGTLKTIAKEGDTLAIGAAVGRIDESGAAAPVKEAAPAQPVAEAAPAPVVAPAPAAAPVPASNGSAPLQVKVPTVGESITEVTLSRWLKKDGDQVAMDEPLAELESDKATFELTAEKAGTLKTIAKEGDVLAIGAVVCTIEGAGAASTAAPKTETPVAAAATAAATTEKTYASGTPSPAAAKILAEKGIDPKSVPGNGVGGRITKNDAMTAVTADLVSENPQGGRVKSEVGSPKSEVVAPKTQDSGLKTLDSTRERREKMSPLRKTVARRLVTVKNETAMLTTFNEVDMSPIMEIRAKYKDKFKEKYGVGLGFMSFFTKAVCEALKEWPAVNARIEGEELVYSNFADISIAVSAPKGLVVPVIRNADSMSLADIEKAVAALAAKARDSKLTIDEMTGGTFTITNGGVFGSMMSTPIINSPQSAILGMHNIIERPVAVNGQVVIKPMMYVALSYDHRIIDGRESVSFLVRVKQLLEDPARLLLGV